MARYKGQRTAAEIDRDYPHQVCLDVPRQGVGARMNEITTFCRERDYANRTGDDRFVHQANWCFRSAGETDEFHTRFSPIWTLPADRPMSIETLGEADRANWSVSAQCLGRDGNTKKGTRPCPHKVELDLPTLVWTRGRDFPLARLPERLMCPSCGCRKMLVYFNKPDTTGHAMMGA